MKKPALVFIAVILFFAGPAFAASKFEPASDKTTNADISLMYGGEPFNTGMGVTMGGGMGITYMSTSSTGLRADLNYLNWSRTTSGVTLNYRRLPIFLGFRFFQSSQIPYFFEAGVESSLDSVDSVAGTITSTTSSTRFGLSGGLGVEAPVGEKFYVGGDIRYHVVTDFYYTVAISFGTKF
jgi:opacity protein-like surface antigen